MQSVEVDDDRVLEHKCHGEEMTIQFLSRVSTARFATNTKTTFTKSARLYDFDLGFFVYCGSSHSFSD